MTPEQHKTVLDALNSCESEQDYTYFDPRLVKAAIAIMEADVPEADCGNMPAFKLPEPISRDDTEHGQDYYTTAQIVEVRRATIAAIKERARAIRAARQARWQACAPDLQRSQAG